MDKYQEFDDQIFAITRVMLGFSLTDGQKTELRQVAGEMEQAWSFIHIGRRRRSD